MRMKQGIVRAVASLGHPRVQVESSKEVGRKRPLAALAVGLFIGIEVGAIYWVANLL